mmetsp:Transcript_2205/g.5121  ORF Transcript_2205/g.5121 Transcript_2205/m.5121 type:complete len:314 (+) Transcript_2205:120-1061(+)
MADEAVSPAPAVAAVDTAQVATDQTSEVAAPEAPAEQNVATLQPNVEEQVPKTAGPDTEPALPLETEEANSDDKANTAKPEQTTPPPELSEDPSAIQIKPQPQTDEILPEPVQAEDAPEVEPDLDPAALVAKVKSLEKELASMRSKMAMMNEQRSLCPRCSKLIDPEMTLSASSDGESSSVRPRRGPKRQRWKHTLSGTNDFDRFMNPYKILPSIIKAPEPSPPALGRPIFGNIVSQKLVLGQSPRSHGSGMSTPSSMAHSPRAPLSSSPSRAGILTPRPNFRSLEAPSQTPRSSDLASRSQSIITSRQPSAA